MRETITVEKEIETDGKYCEIACEWCVPDVEVAECGLFHYSLKIEEGKVLRCIACLRASGIE